ncbi:hypothetical protein TL16_g01505 [Triparma laevis f. inornata]|uniref:Kinesin light chain n=1 Tax=Triparma laevis f. inornata TaxID=1714386 RepID=A0A9W7DWX5_9STRA|nr:hypothetical protein TL16_g01505 [Triparma laevis f. inornata]
MNSNPLAFLAFEIKSDEPRYYYLFKMMPEDQKKVILGCSVIVTVTQTKCSVVKRQGMKVCVAFPNGKKSWLEIKDLELGEREKVGGGEVEVHSVLPPHPPERELERVDRGRERTESHVKMGEGGEVKVIKLMPTTKEDMTELTGMNNLKNKINGIAAEVLKEKVMDDEKFASFKDMSEQESDAKDLGELYEEAGKVLPVFAETMRGIVEGLGMDADRYPTGRARAEEKIKDDYEGNFKCMLDLVRCSIIVETEEQLGGALDKMLELGIVVRLKNRFANPLPTGIRDCLMNVKINGHICEVQLHLSYIIKEKGAMHKYYNFFRDKFAGASAYTEIMRKVEALELEGGEENVEYSVSKLLEEGDLGKLRGLGDIVGRKKGFGDVKLDFVLRRRIVEVISSLEAVVREVLGDDDGEGGEARKLELMDAYNELGGACGCVDKQADRRKYYKLALEGYEELQGTESEKALEVTYHLIMSGTCSGYSEMIEKLRSLVKRCERALGEENSVTLDTLNELGISLNGNEEYEEAKEVHEKCLAGRLQLYGEQHKDTVGTLNNLGCVYDELKNDSKALKYFKRALKGYEKLLGKSHPHTLSTMMNIAVIYATKGDLQSAEFHIRKVVDGNVAQLGKDNEATKGSVHNLNNCLKLAGDTKAMEELNEEYPWLLDEDSDSDESSSSEYESDSEDEEGESDSVEVDSETEREIIAYWNSTKTLKCPSGHELNEFLLEEDYLCSLCGQEIVEGSKMQGCRTCDIDVCEKCIEEITQ